MSIVKNIARLAPAARQLSTSTVSQSAAAKPEVAEGFKTLKNLQAEYQKHDGKPIFLKRGVTDQILYRLTMAGCVVGLGGVVKLIYDLA